MSKKLGTPILEKFIEEGVSGTLIERPALTEAIAFCALHKGEVSYLIVKDVDRVARDTGVYLTIKRTFSALGVQIYSINQPSIDQTPEGRFLENIFTGVAQLERDKILQRTLAGQQEAREAGSWISPPPYGYETDRSISRAATLKPHQIRAKVVYKAFQLYAEGADQQEVCDALNTLGYRTAREGKFTKQTMSYLLRNPAYIGKIRDPKNKHRLIQGLHEPIVPDELWRRVQSRLSRKGAYGSRPRFNPQFPLTNVLLCPICCGPLTGGFSKGKSGKRYGYYHCNKKGCRSKNIPHERIEEQFESALKRIQPSGHCMKLFEEDFITVHRQKWQQTIAEKVVLERRITEMEGKRNRIEEAFIMGKIQEETYNRQLAAVQLDLLRATEARENHVLSEDRIKEILLFSRKFLSSIWNTWKNGTPERKRIIQRLIFPVGLRCTTEGTLGTLELPPLLRLIEDCVDDRSDMVDRVGLEPTTNCLRGNCSTN